MTLLAPPVRDTSPRRVAARGQRWFRDLEAGRGGASTMDAPLRAALAYALETRAAEATVRTHPQRGQQERLHRERVARRADAQRRAARFTEQARRFRVAREERERRRLQRQHERARLRHEQRTLSLLLSYLGLPRPRSPRAA